jgi:hypothetical protein
MNGFGCMRGRRGNQAQGRATFSSVAVPCCRIDSRERVATPALVSVRRIDVRLDKEPETPAPMANTRLSLTP